MVTKHQWGETVTLEDVERFRRVFLHSFHLQDCAVMVHSIKKGSFKVVWFVVSLPVDLPWRKGEGNINFLEDFKVDSVVIDGECVYKEPSWTVSHF